MFICVVSRTSERITSSFQKSFTVYKNAYCIIANIYNSCSHYQLEAPVVGGVLDHAWFLIIGTGGGGVGVKPIELQKPCR